MWKFSGGLIDIPDATANKDSLSFSSLCGRMDTILNRKEYLYEQFYCQEIGSGLLSSSSYVS